MNTEYFLSLFVYVCVCWEKTQLWLYVKVVINKNVLLFSPQHTRFFNICYIYKI